MQNLPKELRFKIRNTTDRDINDVTLALYNMAIDESAWDTDIVNQNKDGIIIESDIEGLSFEALIALCQGRAFHCNLIIDKAIPYRLIHRYDVGVEADQDIRHVLPVFESIDSSMAGSNNAGAAPTTFNRINTAPQNSKKVVGVKIDVTPYVWISLRFDGVLANSEVIVTLADIQEDSELLDMPPVMQHAADVKSLGIPYSICVQNHSNKVIKDFRIFHAVTALYNNSPLVANDANGITVKTKEGVVLSTISSNDSRRSYHEILNNSNVRPFDVVFTQLTSANKLQLVQQVTYVTADSCGQYKSRIINKKDSYQRLVCDDGTAVDIANGVNNIIYNYRMDGLSRLEFDLLPETEVTINVYPRLELSKP